MTLLAACGETTPTVAPTATQVSSTTTTANSNTTTTTSAATTSAIVATSASAAKPETTATPTLTSAAKPTAAVSQTSTAATIVSGTVQALPTPTPLTSQSLRAFLNPEFGMAYPSDWKFSNNTGGRYLFESSELGYGVSIDVTPTVTGETATDSLQNYLFQLANNNPGFQIITTTVGTGAGGVDAAGAVVLLPDPNDKQNFVEAFVEKMLSGTADYTIIASSNAKDYAAHAPSLQLCLNSFAPLVLPNVGKGITDTVTYQDKDLSFSYPKDWQLDNTGGLSPGAALTIYNPQYPDVKADLFIATGSDAAAYNQATLLTINQAAADVSSVPYSSIKISDTLTLQHTVAFYISGSGFPVYKFIDSYADSKSNTVYSIQTSSIAVHYLVFSDSLALIENSFKPE